MLSSVEAWELPFERPLPDLVVDLCSTLFLQDVVDTAEHAPRKPNGQREWAPGTIFVPQRHETWK